MNDGVVGSKAASAVSSGRRTWRLAAAVLASLVGVLYLLVATQVVHVSDTTGKASPFVPMAAAALVFWLGAVVLLLLDRQIVYLLGAAVQLVVIVGYFAVAPSRDPHIEPWGLLIKAAQVAILAILLYLAVTAPPASRGRSAARS